MTKFNLPFLVYNSLDIGSTVLSSVELSRLQDGNILSGGVSISPTSVVSLIVQLFNRYDLYNIQYYFSGSQNVSISISQNGDVWENKSVTYRTGYAETGNISSNVNFIKFIKIVHTISTPSNIFEIRIINDDSGNGYWYDGSKEELDVDSSGDSEASEVQVFNRTQSSKNFYCLIDIDSSTDSGSTIKLSTSSSGLYYGRYETGIKSNRDFNFSSGEFLDSVVSGTSVILDNSIEGYYYSPVLDVTSYYPLRVFWESDSDLNTSVDQISSVDGSDTISYRISNITPEIPWTTGNSPSATDPIWGTISGSLLYNNVPNNTILDINIGQYSYLQLAVRLNTSVSGQTPILNNLGVEESLCIENISSNSYKSIYAKTTVSGYSVGDISNILTFYIES
jgi:hypothetical protein